MSRRVVLFVDDEPNVLSGLARMLRRMRQRWDMIFVDGGAKALKVMAERPVDVIVSDMRMPGMDGPALLRRVMREHPDVIRIALSGYSDMEMVGASIAPTHQYLTKPCTEDRLVSAIAQALAARDLIPNRALLDKLARIEHLPVLPEAYTRIAAELSGGDPSPRVIGDIVAGDVALSANILKLVNSSYFGLPQHVSTPQRAVIVLGVSVIRSVILALHVFKSFESCPPKRFSLPLLWDHCTRAGAIARDIAQRSGLNREMADYASIAAMLHDVGKLILCSQCAEESDRVYAEVRARNRRVAEVEAEMLGVTHAEVGAYLLGLWGLPEPVVRAVARHHAPRPAAEDVGVEGIVYCANLLDHEVFIVHEEYARGAPAPERLAAVGGPERYAEWREAAALLNLDGAGK